MYRQKSSIFVKYSADFGPSLHFALRVRSCCWGQRRQLSQRWLWSSSFSLGWAETLECVMLILMGEGRGTLQGKESRSFFVFRIMFYFMELHVSTVHSA